MRSKFVYYFTGILTGWFVTAVLIPKFKGNSREEEFRSGALNGGAVDNVKANVVSTQSSDSMGLRLEIDELRMRLSKYERAQSNEKDLLNSQKLKFIRQRLATYDTLFELTPEQRELIGEIEWETSQYWKYVREGRINVKEIPFPKVDEEVNKILFPEQLAIYEEHLEKRKYTSADMASTVFLDKYPVALSLSDEQEDFIYKNLFLTFHPDTQGEFDKKWNEFEGSEFDRNGQKLVWSAEGVLDDEQMSKLKSLLRKKE